MISISQFETAITSGQDTYLKSKRQSPLYTILAVRAGQSQPTGKAIEDHIVKHDDDAKFTTSYAAARLGLVHTAG